MPQGMLFGPADRGGCSVVSVSRLNGSLVTGLRPLGQKEALKIKAHV